jgi:ribose transport system permease protein
MADAGLATVEREPGPGAGLLRLLRLTFIHLGVLPLLLIILVAGFGIWEPRFLSGQNIFNVARQATYLTVVSMGQMVALLTGGFDLSVGVILAMTSVVLAKVMASMVAGNPQAVGLAISFGILAGLGAGTTMGIVNGFGVAALPSRSASPCS